MKEYRFNLDRFNDLPLGTFVDELHHFIATIPVEENEQVTTEFEAEPMDNLVELVVYVQPKKIEKRNNEEVISEILNLMRELCG